jgi:hypothetical protein
VALRHFRYSEEVVPRIVSKARARALRRLAFLLPVGGIAVAFATSQLRQMHAARELPALLFVSGVVCLVCIGACGGLVIAWVRADARLRSFELLLGDDALSSKGGGLPPLTLLRTEVTRIATLRDGLCVFGRDPRHAIAVPAELDAFPELRAALESWRTLDPFSVGDDILGRTLRIIVREKFGNWQVKVALWAVLIVLFFAFYAIFSR